MARGDRRQCDDQPVPQKQSVVRTTLSDQEAERLSESKWKMDCDSAGWATLMTLHEVSTTCVSGWDQVSLRLNLGPSAYADGTDKRGVPTKVNPRNSSGNHQFARCAGCRLLERPTLHAPHRDENE
jgi:hypothetical protein